MTSENINKAVEETKINQIVGDDFDTIRVPIQPQNTALEKYTKKYHPKLNKLIMKMSKFTLFLDSSLEKIFQPAYIIRNSIKIGEKECINESYYTPTKGIIVISSQNYQLSSNFIQRFSQSKFASYHIQYSNTSILILEQLGERIVIREENARKLNAKFQIIKEIPINEGNIYRIGNTIMTVTRMNFKKIFLKFENRKTKEIKEIKLKNEISFIGSRDFPDVFIDDYLIACRHLKIKKANSQ